MTFTEEAILFNCAQDALFGILALPEAAATMAVVIVVGGPQYRVGSHRQFVHLSRALAGAGYAVLRFDYRGMGDSDGEPRQFEAVQDDIRAAIDALQSRLPAVSHVALWGLCDAASAALMYSHEAGDKRVRLLCLVNPWVRSEASLARTHIKHYYLQRLGQAAFWRKLLRGQVAAQAARDLAGNFRAALAGKSRGSSDGAKPPAAETTSAPFQQRMAAAWNAFPGSIAVLLSGNDLTAREFVEVTRAATAWRDAWQRPHRTRHDIPGADHTFSSAQLREQVAQWTVQALRVQGGP